MPPPPQGPPPWHYGPPPPPRPPSRLGRFFGALNPIKVARIVFHPQRPDRIVDRTVRRLQYLRSWTGIVLTVAVLLAYSAAVPQEIADERFDQLWISMLAMMCTVPVVVGAFILACRPPGRGVFLRRTARPLAAVPALFGTAFLFPLAMAPELQGLRDLADPVAPVLVPVAVLIMLVWVLPFFFYGFFLALTHVFRTADIHELVPPLISTSLAWVLALIDLLNDANKGVPPTVGMVLLLGTPMSVTAIAGYEAYRLRKFHSITLRNTLLR